MRATKTSYKGYIIEHLFPGQWDVTVPGDDSTVHLFRSRKAAVAWIDAQPS